MDINDLISTVMSLAESMKRMEAAVTRLENRGSPREQQTGSNEDSFATPTTPLQNIVNDRRVSGIFTGLQKEPFTIQATPKYFETVPDLEHYKLKKLSVRSYVGFIKKHATFVATYGQDARPFAMFFADNVKNLLIAAQSDLEYTEAHFALATKAQIQSMVRKKIQVKTLIEMQESLSNDVFFPNSDHYQETNFSFGPLTFKKYYEDLLAYRTNFKLIFDFQVDENPYNVSPRIENKEGGLIKIFLDKIPVQDYVKSVFQEIILVEKRFTNVQDFLDRLYTQFRKDSEIAEEAVLLAKRGNSAQRQTRITAKTPYNVAHTPTRTPQRLMEMQEIESDSAEVEEQRPQLHILQREVVTKPFSNPKPGQPKPKAAACLQFTLSGTCNRGDVCPYSHDDAKCREFFLEHKNAVERCRFNTTDPYVKPHRLINLQDLDEADSPIEDFGDPAELK